MNGFLRLAACSSCLILLLTEAASAKPWRGIAPLRSTRADVARLYKQLAGAPLSGIGLPQDSFSIAGEGMVLIQYSQGRCVEGWGVKRDTVVRITVNLTEPVPFGDVRAELERLPWDEDDAGALYYMNNRDGIYYAVQGGRVTSITYAPDERDQKLACKKVVLQKLPCSTIYCDR